MFQETFLQVHQSAEQFDLQRRFRPWLFTIAANKAKKIPVKIGFNDGTNIEILNGITTNDPVIAFGKQAIADGQPIHPADAK